jgi:NAD(P)H-dependent flavin oxidoreductase YrpB (nitropropane dioxygenase family)
LVTKRLGNSLPVPRFSFSPACLGRRVFFMPVGFYRKQENSTLAFTIIQGGMGVGVSGWPLARAVSQLGQLGVVSGTGLAVMLSRRLGRGDPGGHIRRALAKFPVPAMAQRILDRYYVAGGKGSDEAFTPVTMPRIELPLPFLELTVVANFVEVWLAKEGHDGVVGINYLEKMQIPTLPQLLGSMLAGVDYILMGAGIPRSIPGILDAFAAGKAAEMRFDVEDARPDDHFTCRLDPTQVLGMTPNLARPKFLAIVASVVLAMTLARKSNGRVDGFVVEGPTAGGHNAPPRGPLKLSELGEPVYGQRDDVDLAAMRELGLPFWLAGGFAEPGRLKEALAAGAQGIQVGTVFAFCAESSVTEELKRQVLGLSRSGTAVVFTDPQASPTGFPFKVSRLEGTLSEPQTYEQRTRTCDIGGLRRLYRREDGTVGYRCPAEPVEQYVAKGGNEADTLGRKCLCNALFANIGLGQPLEDGQHELALVTAGDDVVRLSRLLKDGRETYTARDVVEYLLGG